MYAIIKTGGKQYRVAPGKVIDVELLNGEEGASIEFTDVLFFNNGSEAVVGAPLVQGVTVVAKILGEAKGPKITSIKYKKRQNIRRKFGHRQKYSRLKIEGINESKSKNKGE